MVQQPVQIDEESMRKAKRSRKILIVIVIIVLVIAAAAIIFGVYFMHTQATTAESKTEATSITVSDDQSGVASGVATTSIPDLAECIGKTSSEALSVLGKKATLDSTETTDSGTVATFSIAPDKTTTSSKASAAKVYLTEDASGHATEVLYTVSLDALGYANTSFKDTAQDSEFIEKVLVQAGTEVTSGTLKMPADKDYQTMGKNDSGVEIVTKEDYTWTGSTGLSAAPMNYELRLVFDHSLSASTKDASALERTLYLKLK